MDEFNYLVNSLRDYLKTRKHQINIKILADQPEDTTRLLRAEYFCLNELEKVFEEKVKKARIENNDD